MEDVYYFRCLLDLKHVYSVNTHIWNVSDVFQTDVLSNWPKEIYEIRTKNVHGKSYEKNKNALFSEKGWCLFWAAHEAVKRHCWVHLISHKNGMWTSLNLRVMQFTLKCDWSIRGRACLIKMRVVVSPTCHLILLPFLSSQLLSQKIVIVDLRVAGHPVPPQILFFGEGCLFISKTCVANEKASHQSIKD